MKRKSLVASLMVVLAVLTAFLVGCSSGQAGSGSASNADSSTSAPASGSSSGESGFSSTSESSSAASNAGKAPDYSQESSWLKIPTITKDVDTFYIYSTAYIESSFKEGAPVYATLDNEEMQADALGEYVTNASVFEDSTNVFVPYYRQKGMAFAEGGSKKAKDKVNIGRGVVVTNAKAAPIAMTENFGPASFHDDDYTFCYNNIKDNVAKRIAAYEENR